MSSTMKRNTGGVSRQDMFLSKSTSALMIDCKHKTKNHITFVPKANLENRKRSAPVINQLPLDSTQFNILATSVCEPFDSAYGSYYDSPLLKELSAVVKPSVTKLDILHKSTDGSDLVAKEESVKLPQPKKILKKLVLAPIRPAVLNIPVVMDPDLPIGSLDTRSLLSLESGCNTGTTPALSPTNAKKKAHAKRQIIQDNLDRPISPMAMGGRFSPSQSMNGSQSYHSPDSPSGMRMHIKTSFNDDTLSVEEDERFRDNEPFDDNLLESDQLAQLSTSVLSRTPKPVVQPPVGTVSMMSLTSLSHMASLREQPRVSKQQIVFGNFEDGVHLIPTKKSGRTTQSSHSVVLPTTTLNSGESSQVLMTDSLVNTNSLTSKGGVDAVTLQNTISAMSSVALSESLLNKQNSFSGNPQEVRQLHSAQQQIRLNTMTEIRYPLRGKGLSKTITPSANSFAPRPVSISLNNRRSVSPEARGGSPPGTPSRPRTVSPGRLRQINDANQLQHNQNVLNNSQTESFHPNNSTLEPVSQALPPKSAARHALAFDIEIDGDSINSELESEAPVQERRTVGSRAQSPSGNRSRGASGNKKTITLRINSAGELYDANANLSGLELDEGRASVIDVATINSQQIAGDVPIGSGPGIASRQKSRSALTADSGKTPGSRVGSRSHLSIAGVSTELQQKSLAESSTSMKSSKKSPSKRSSGSQHQVAYVLNPSGGISVHSASVGSVTRHIASTSFDTYIDGESTIGSVSNSLNEGIVLNSPQNTLPPPFFTDETDSNLPIERVHDKYSNVSNVGGGVVPFQVHRRIMGWKLTSLSRRRDLVSLLDVVSNKDPRDVMSGHNVTGNRRRKNMASVSQVKSSLLSMSQVQLDHMEIPEMSTTHEELSALHARQSQAWQKSVTRLVKFRQSYSSVEAIKFLVEERKMRDEKRKNILRYGVLSRGADLVGQVDHMGIGLDEPDSFLQSWSRSPSRGGGEGSPSRNRSRTPKSPSRAGSPSRPVDDAYNYPVNMHRPKDRMDILNSVKSRSLLQTYREQGQEDRVIEDFLESKYRHLYNNEAASDDDESSLHSQMSQDSSSRLLLHQERYLQSSAEREERAGGMTWNANVEADEQSQGLNMDDDLSSLGDGGSFADGLNGELDGEKEEVQRGGGSRCGGSLENRTEITLPQSQIHEDLQGEETQSHNTALELDLQRGRSNTSSPIKLGDEMSETGSAAAAGFQIPVNNW